MQARFTIRRWGMLGLLAAVIVVAGVGLYGVRQARSQTPLTITGPNILPNADWSINTDGDTSLPDGWTRGPTGVQLSDQGSFDNQGRSVQMQGVNNFLRSPEIAARPGAEYRVAFRALSNDVATQARVLFHWRDADGIEFAVDRGEWQPVPVQQWNTIVASAIAPPDATRVSISIRVASDDVIFVDDLSMGQLGVRVNPWPDGKQAALAFSFDYETAMGGLVHGKSDDPNAANPDYLDRARRMRAGADQALQLFAPHDIRATFYTNGYNFLTGNPDCRTFMDDPTYAWANRSEGARWQFDWGTRPWFADDPCTTEAAAPEWYFGSQVERLQAAGQDLQSHTFAHFAGTYVTSDDWRKDFAAWNEVAATRGVAPATSLAFPWSSSAGMSFASWDVLEAHGIRSITRTTWNPAQGRSIVADRERYALRRLPAHPITVIADEYLTPESRAHVLARMHTARLNEGAIDVWAHTEEVTSPEQIAAWQATIDAAVKDFWVAPVPEIVQYAEAIALVTIQVDAEAPQYRFTIRNGSDHDLSGVTLTLPFVPTAVTIDEQAAQADGHTLTLDLAPSQSRTIVLNRSDGSEKLRDHARAGEAAWPA